jgi:hypothetical protein
MKPEKSGKLAKENFSEDQPKLSRSAKAGQYIVKFFFGLSNCSLYYSSSGYS